MPAAEQANTSIDAKIRELQEKRAHLMEGGGKSASGSSINPAS